MITAKEHHEAVIAYRTAIGSGSLKATLACAALACDEARYAIMLAGDPDQRLIEDLLSVRQRLASGAQDERIRTQGP